MKDIIESGKTSTYRRESGEMHSSRIGRLLLHPTLQKPDRRKNIPPKSRHQQPDGNNPRFCKGSCQADRTDRTASRQLGRFCRHPHPLRILAGTGKQAARPFPIYSPRSKARFRLIVSRLRKMGDKPPCTLNRTAKVLYPMNKA